MIPSSTLSQTGHADDVWVLQFCHGYDGPFLDCARQYAALFAGSAFKVCTVYLTGAPEARVVEESASDEVIFLNYRSSQIRGLKFSAIKKMREIAKSRNFRLCIAHRFKPTYIALLATKLPVLGVQHAFAGYRRFSRQALAYAFENRLRLIGVSNAVRDEIRLCLKRWPSAHIQTLYNRVDIEALQSEQYAQDESRQRLNLPAKAWIIGNVGRLHPDKDQSTLIKAFAQARPKLAPNSLLAIAGSGRLEAELRELASSLGVADAVLFLGQIPYARRYFKAFDVFALTSDSEPFGMVLLEAMSAEIPVICSDCGGGAEVVSEHGLLFPFADVDALAKSLVTVYQATDETLQHRVSQGLEALRLKFSDQAVTHVFFDHLEDFSGGFKLG